MDMQVGRIEFADRSFRADLNPTAYWPSRDTIFARVVGEGPARLPCHLPPRTPSPDLAAIADFDLVAANDNHLSTSPRLIGLIGYGGAGKTSVANILRTRHHFVGPHIGLPLKNMLRSLLRDFDVPADMIERYIDGDLKRAIIPELGVTSTEAQQTLGTDWGRKHVDPALWLRNWLLRVDKVLVAGGRVVQESVRFENEAEAIRQRGGTIVLVDRPGVGPLPGGHESEVLPTEPDVVIHNNGSIFELGRRVSELVA